ncbi:MFS transporter [Paenibacillus phoenicis]|uniref:MFS transporter n=1 Tax=Paenibacillus phoenicis TaxID=554117 RepID=A0ABU5PGL7_9BACL|nr:MFS transporter [Paenibacillus phoenicis]MEA3569083.1 MFS transporter [Paenibacillus phoenicis]
MTVASVKHRSRPDTDTPVSVDLGSWIEKNGYEISPELPSREIYFPREMNGTLLAGRILSSFAHGTLFGTIVVTAKDLARPGREGRSIAFVSSGLTVSVILGAPLGTLLGQLLGWRFPFLIITLLTAIAWIGVMKQIQPLPRPEGMSLKGQLRIFNVDHC